MACYNMFIPHIVPDLPEKQAAALRLRGKSPLQYTTRGARIGMSSMRSYGLAYNCLQARNCCVNSRSSAMYSLPCSFV